MITLTAGGKSGRLRSIGYIIFFFVLSRTIEARSQQVYPRSCKILLINKASFDRQDEVVSIKRSQLAINNKLFFPIVKQGHKTCITQVTDDNLDGEWDNLLIQVSIKSRGQITLDLQWVKKDLSTSFPKLTNVRFSLKTKTGQPEQEITRLTRLRGFVQNIADPLYQMEGPGIENDKVAFRAFFDSRNGKDIYGKITSLPILEKVGVGGSWHTLQEWGMDIFKTGNSLSAGALAVKHGSGITRLADADTSIFQAMYEGPLRAAFRLDFKNWDIAQNKADGSETISMTKGDFYYKNNIIVPLQTDQQLISGIADFSQERAVHKVHNAEWSSISTYGPQAEGTGTKLGVAIMFATNQYVTDQKSDQGSSIPNSSYVVLNPYGAKQQEIYFFACWEKTDPRFSTRTGFESYLSYVAQLLSNPIQIKII